VIEVRNKNFFRDLTNYYISWSLLEDGKSVQSGKLYNVDIAPLQVKKYTIPVTYATLADREYYLNIKFLLKTAESLLEKDYEIASEQFALTQFKSTDFTPVTGEIRLESKTDECIIRGNKFSVTFDLSSGLMKEYKYKGQTLIITGSQVNFWRAMTDNDHGAGLNKRLREWLNAGKTEKPNVRVSEGNPCKITVKRNLFGDDAVITQTYSIYPDGKILVENDFVKKQGQHALMPKFGNIIVVASPYRNLTYYGRGPWENYIDRNYSADMGLYSSTVDEQYVSYVRPQECGNKTDVRWLSLTDKNGQGLKITGYRPIEFSALPYAIEDLDPEEERNQYHAGELNKRKEIYLNIDFRQMGVAGIDSWGSLPLDNYCLTYNSYSYQYTIEPCL
jgi:beta-galactosidase